jgi:hypothetical protein
MIVSPISRATGWNSIGKTVVRGAISEAKKPAYIPYAQQSEDRHYPDYVF